MSALDRLKLLGDRADAMTRHRAEAELQAEAEQRQRRSEERERRREHATRAESEHVQALRHEIADLRHELANVQAHLTERDRDFLGIVDNLVNLSTQAGALSRPVSEGEMAGKIAERFGELMGRIEALGPHPARAARGDFKFAAEKASDGDDVVDLPNWRSRTIN